MFIKTFKISRAELVIMLIGLICFIATLWYIISSASTGGAEKASAAPASQVQHFLCTLYTNVQQKNNLVNTKEEVVGQAAFRYNNLVKSK